MIRKIKDDEKFSPSVDVKESIATCTYAVRQNESAGDRYALTTAFDFTNVTPEEVIELACKTLIVDRQRAWRVLAASNKKEATDKNPYALQSVRELLDAPRTRSAAPAITKAKKLVADMSPEDRAALLAMLTEAK